MSKIAELRALVEKAHPGPWYVCDDYDHGCFAGSVYSGPLDDHNLGKSVAYCEVDGFKDHDAALIVAMRNALSDLLDVVEAAQAISTSNFDLRDMCYGCGEDLNWRGKTEHRPSCKMVRLDAALAKLGAT